MHIVRATAADLPAVSRLAHLVWHRTYPSIISGAQISYMLARAYTPAALRRQLTRQGHTFLLVAAGGQTVGFAAAVPPTPAGVVHLAKIYLHPDVQGRGWGRCLLDATADHARAAGAGALTLNVNRANPAVGFYQRCGFTILRAVDVPLGPYLLNDYVMHRPLT